MHNISTATRKFLEGQSTSEEAKDVIQLLNTELISVDEWREWNHVNDAVLNSGMAKQACKKIFANYPTGNNKYIPGFRMRFMMRAAAILLTVAVTAVLYNISHTRSQSRLPATTLTAVNDHQIVNNSSDTINITLRDNSRIRLFPKAMIHFDVDSLKNGSKRNIYLSGSAHFDVAVDSKRPFTVYTKSLFTTALGTSFDVIEKNNNCLVKLYTGKVVVGEIQPFSWNGKVYLLPGELVNLDGKKMRFQKQQQRVSRSAITTRQAKADISSMQFDNAPLTDVFAALEQKFNQSIRFDTIVTNQLYFTGEVLPKDSLRSVIKIICDMNALSVKDSAGVFVVKP